VRRFAPYCLAVWIGLVVGAVVGIVGVRGEVIKPGLTRDDIRVFYGSEACVSFLSEPLHSEFGARSDEEELAFWVPFYQVVFALFGGLIGLAAWDIVARIRKELH
jgi:hypothetical protein